MTILFQFCMNWDRQKLPERKQGLYGGMGKLGKPLVQNKGHFPELSSSFSKVFHALTCHISMQHVSEHQQVVRLPEKIL